MKRISIMVLMIVWVFSLIACGQDKKISDKTSPIQQEPDTKTTPEAEPFSKEYVEILKSGTYQYSYVVTYENVEMITTEAARNGDSVYKVAAGDSSVRLLQMKGEYIKIDDKTGEVTESSAEENLGGKLDFSDMKLISTEEKDQKVFEKYSMRRNDQDREFTFVFENEKLIGISLSYLEDEAPYYVVKEFTAEVEEDLFTIPEKSTLEISEIAEGTYTGILSGASYSGTFDDNTYSISQNISPAEVSITIKEEKVELYCSAKVNATGSVLEVEAPPSPEFTQTVKGMLQLSQIDQATVRAEEDITLPVEVIWIYWDDNKKFTEWGVKTEDRTYHCKISITLVEGNPTAEIVIDGSKSSRTCLVPLNLNDDKKS